MAESLDSPPSSDALSIVSSDELDTESDTASVFSVKYVPEKLVDLKMDKEGKKLFLVKWNDYPDEENTWETESNLSCNSLMDAMVQEKLAKGTPGKLYRKNKIAKKFAFLKKSKPPMKKMEFKYVKFEKRITGFNLGYTPETIVGATKICGQLEFLMRWREDDRIDLIPRLVANEKCPQLVIKFYEQNMVWTASSRESIEK